MEVLIQQIQKILANSWWRILAFILLTIGITAILFLLVHSFAITSHLPENLIIVMALLFSSIIIESLRKSSHWYLFGLKPDISAIFEMFSGFAIVVAAFGIISIIYLALGGTFQINPLNLNGIAYIAYFLFVGAFLEELLCRGIIFQALSSRLGGVLATLIMSTFFASLHLFNTGINIVSFLNVFLAGVVLSTMYLKTKSLWVALSFHFFWNFLQVVAIDSPVSGLSYFSQYAIFDWTVATSSNISSLLLGGEFGIEGGIITTILLVSIFVLILKFGTNSQGINSLLLKRAIAESKL